MADHSSTPAVRPVPATFYCPERFDRQDSVGYLMRRIMQRLVTRVDHQLQDVGLTQAQWAPLFTMRKFGITTLAELSRELQIDPGALTRTFDRLEAKGLVKRERSSSDRRVVNITLTEAGLEAIEPVPRVLCQVMNEYLAGFSQEEWETLLSLLHRMLANAQACRDAACGGSTTS